jgi:hypothetical protein
MVHGPLPQVIAPAQEPPLQVTEQEPVPQVMELEQAPLAHSTVQPTAWEQSTAPEQLATQLTSQFHPAGQVQPLAQGSLQTPPTQLEQTPGQDPRSGAGPSGAPSGAGRSGGRSAAASGAGSPGARSAGARSGGPRSAAGGWSDTGPSTGASVPSDLGPSWTGASWLSDRGPSWTGPSDTAASLATHRPLTQTSPAGHSGSQRKGSNDPSSL